MTVHPPRSSNRFQPLQYSIDMEEDAVLSNNAQPEQRPFTSQESKLPLPSENTDPSPHLQDQGTHPKETYTTLTNQDIDIPMEYNADSHHQRVIPHPTQAHPPPSNQHKCPLKVFTGKHDSTSFNNSNSPGLKRKAGRKTLQEKLQISALEGIEDGSQTLLEDLLGSKKVVSS